MHLAILPALFAASAVVGLWGWLARLPLYSVPLASWSFASGGSAVAGTVVALRAPGIRPTMRACLGWLAIGVPSVVSVAVLRFVFAPPSVMPLDGRLVTVRSDLGSVLVALEMTLIGLGLASAILAGVATAFALRRPRLLVIQAPRVALAFTAMLPFAWVAAIWTARSPAAWFAWAPLVVAGIALALRLGTLRPRASVEVVTAAVLFACACELTGLASALYGEFAAIDLSPFSPLRTLPLVPSSEWTPLAASEVGILARALAWIPAGVVGFVHARRLARAGRLRWGRAIGAVLLAATAGYAWTIVFTHVASGLAQRS